MIDEEKEEQRIKTWIMGELNNLDLKELVEIQNTIQAMLIHYGMEEGNG